MRLRFWGKFKLSKEDEYKLFDKNLAESREELKQLEGKSVKTAEMDDNTTIKITFDDGTVFSIMANYCEFPLMPFNMDVTSPCYTEDSNGNLIRL